jgi:hypothetical protein
LIYESLILAEAEVNLAEQHKQLIEEEVEDTLREMIANAGGSRQSLEEYYRRQHTTLDDVMEDHRRRITGQLYLQSVIEPAIHVNRRMMLEYYDQHEDEFVQHRRVQMQLVSVPFEDFLPDTGSLEPTPTEWKQARRQAREKIEQAAAEVQGGVDFAAVARKYSHGFHADDGGIWPPMEAGSFRETEVERNAFALKEGQVCGIIETENGFYIVKTLKVESGSRIGFEDAQERIEEILRQQQYEQLSKDYFMKLFEEATIAQSGEFMEAAVEEAVDRYWYGD